MSAQTYQVGSHFTALIEGPSIKVVPSKSGLFDPLPPCPLYDVIVTIKVALLCPLWADPPLPPDLGRPFWMAPKNQTLIFDWLTFQIQLNLQSTHGPRISLV